MSKFDVFINGIQPNRIADTQKIIDELSEKFKISREQIETIVATPNTRIRESASKEEAEQLQQALYKIGLICLCRPGAEKKGLSLEPLEVKSESGLGACPSCDTKFSEDLSVTPEVCENCGIYIKKYLETHDDNNEKEQIRQQLLRKKAQRDHRVKRERSVQDAEIRKKELEQEILEENPNLKDNKKVSMQMLVVLGGCLFVGGGAFFAQKAGLFSGTGMILSSMNAAQEGASGVNFSSSKAQMAVSPESELEMGTSQNSLQKTYDQASQVMEGFGLNPEAFSKGSDAKLGVVSVGGAPTTNREQLSQENSEVSAFLMRFGVDDSEWEYYLAKQAKYAVTHKKFAVAHKIMSYLTDVERFIMSSGGLLQATTNSAFKSQLKERVEAKIKREPLESQARYFAMFAAYQGDKQDSNVLLQRAESAWGRVTDPYQQLLSALTIATSHFKAGDITASDKYFNKIKLLLPKVSTLDNKVSAYVAISRAFQMVGQEQAGLTWLRSTDKLMEGTSLQSLQQVVETYAQFNAINTVYLLVGGAASVSEKDFLRYHAMRASLETGLKNNAISLAGAIEGTENKTLAYTLLASYFDGTLGYLTAAEKLLNRSSISIQGKALLASRIAQQYARKSNISEVNALFKKSEEWLKVMPASNGKDQLLEIMVINYARPLKGKSAMRLAGKIQATGLKVSAIKKVSQLSKIAKLLEK